MYHVKCLYENSRSLPWAVNGVASIDRDTIAKEREASTTGTKTGGRVYKCAELVSRRCTLIRLLCTVIGCDIRPFTRFAEQMEANRGRRSSTEFSLVLGHQLVTRRQVSRSQINVLSVDTETLHVLYDSQYSNQILMMSCDYCITR